MGAGCDGVGPGWYLHRSPFLRTNMHLCKQWAERKSPQTPIMVWISKMAPPIRTKIGGKLVWDVYYGKLWDFFVTDLYSHAYSLKFH